MTLDTLADTPTASDSTTPTQTLKVAIQAIDLGRSQVDILNALLTQCLTYGSCTALLILRGDTFVGWSGSGFTAHGGNDTLVKNFRATPGLLPELDRVHASEVVRWDGASLSTQFGVVEHHILMPATISRDFGDFELTRTPDSMQHVAGLLEVAREKRRPCLTSAPSLNPGQL